MKKCPYCAMEIPEEGRICAYCKKTVSSVAKSKFSAVILAHIFGPLTWLYTWKWDKKKFIFFLVTWVIPTIVLYGTGLFMNDYASKHNLENSFSTGSGWSVFIIGYILISIPFGIWAIILAWARKKEKYLLY